MKSTTLNGILVALVIVLVGVILVQDSNDNPALAVSNDDGARTVSGGGSSTNGIIAVAGQYTSDSSIIYLIDTNREVVLTYGCYGRGYSSPKLDFLCGRNYVWDAIYTQKKGIFGDTERATPVQVKQRVGE